METTEDRLTEIMDQMIKNINPNSFLKAHIKNSCATETIVMSFNVSQIKKIASLLQEKAKDWALLRPIDSDPLYKVNI